MFRSIILLAVISSALAKDSTYYKNALGWHGEFSYRRLINKSTFIQIGVSPNYSRSSNNYSSSDSLIYQITGKPDSIIYYKAGHKDSSLSKQIDLDLSLGKELFKIDRFKVFSTLGFGSTFLWIENLQLSQPVMFTINLGVEPTCTFFNRIYLSTNIGIEYLHLSQVTSTERTNYEEQKYSGYEVQIRKQYDKR